MPIEAALVTVIETYLASRATRLTSGAGRRRGVSPTDTGITAWVPSAPLFVTTTGERITRGIVQSRVARAFTRAGLAGGRGALVHALRHTFATELAHADVSAVKLRDLLGHASIATTQRYIEGAARETRAAARSNPIYGLIDETP